jgi:hypothetical protein
MNLPRTSVRDIDIHGDDMVIATHGRGFWVFDDLSSLRQLASERSPGVTRLFAPATAIRVRPAGFTGTPLPKDEPTAENPPFGARIDYRLATAAKQPVTLEIFDAAGQLVRHYSSADQPSKYDASKAGTAPEWFTPPSMLSTTPGLHRFIWPLRYPALPALAGGNAYVDGAWAQPGRYRLALSVDGQTYQQPLTIAPDPRVDLAAEAYAQQFAFARQIEATQARLATAQTQAQQLHGAIGTARKASGSAPDDALRALDDKVVAIASIVDVPNAGNAGTLPPKSTHTFAFLEQALGKLANAVDGADAAPSPDAHRGYGILMPIVDETLARWQAVLATDLPAVNAQRRAAGLQELTLTPAGQTKTP